VHWVWNPFGQNFLPWINICKLVHLAFKNFPLKSVERINLIVTSVCLLYMYTLFHVDYSKTKHLLLPSNHIIINHYYCTSL
jgi:hypothetical protein